MSKREQHFWSQVHRCPHGMTCTRCCWEWNGLRNTQGYGVFYASGGTVGAHRLALEFSDGALVLGAYVFYHCGRYSHVSRTGPAKFCVMHRCDNPPCCNPQHLHVGSYSDNFRDALRKKALALGCTTDFLLGMDEDAC